MKDMPFTVDKDNLLNLLDYLDPNDKVEIETSIIPDCYDVIGPEEMFNSFLENE